jgi:hypothetical protein
MTKKMAVLVLAVFAAGSLALAAEFPLKAKSMTSEEAMRLPGGFGSMGQMATMKPPAITKEPKAISKCPLYGTFVSPGMSPESRNAGLAFRLDESKGNGKGYDRLIIDFDGNGDLTEDAVIKGAMETSSGGNPEITMFGPIEAPADKQVGPWRPTYYAQMYLFDRSMLKSAGTKSAGTNYMGYLRLRAGNYLETTVDIGGVKQKIGIVDGDCNLRLGDKPTAQEAQVAPGEKFTYFSSSDTVLRDHDGSGKFQNETDAEFCGNLIYFGPNPYNLTLAKDLAALRLEPYSGPTGEMTVANGDKISALTVAWESSPGKCEPLSPDVSSGKAKVPAGSYRLYTCALTAKANDGATLMISGMNRSGKASPVKIAEGNSAALDCGTPLDLQVKAAKVAESSRGASTLNINVSIVGAGGEAYNSFSKMAKGSPTQLDPPKFKVLDQKDQILASGQLEFG